MEKRSYAAAFELQVLQHAKANCKTATAGNIDVDESCIRYYWGRKKKASFREAANQWLDKGIYESIQLSNEFRI